MVDVPTTPAVVAPTTPKKSPKAKKEKKAAGKPKVKSNSHPATAVMVNNAVKELKERKGSSLQAIKKYIAVTYKVDAEKSASYIRKAIKSGVASGALVRTKGIGASGSFKIAGAVGTEKTKKKPAVKSKSAVKPKAAKPAVKPKAAKPAAKPKAAKPAAKPKAAKPAAAKKSPAKTAPKTKKSPAKKAAPKPKSPSKTKKTPSRKSKSLKK